MKALATLSAAALLAAGCATTENTQLAQKDCKVMPVLTTNYANSGKAQPVDSLRMREAEMDLGSSRYRYAQLQRNGMFNNTIEDAMRDCDMGGVEASAAPKQ